MANCRALCTGTADANTDDHGCIRADISLFELGPDHDSLAHLPGRYHLIIMPRYVYSLALQLPVAEKVIAQYLQRLIIAVQHVHDHGLVHMDVKVCTPLYAEHGLHQPQSTRCQTYIAACDKCHQGEVVASKCSESICSMVAKPNCGGI